MAPDEFDRWIKAHTGAFPGLWRWLEETPETLDAWRECLHDVDFEDARLATRQMNRGEYESPPFGEHARTVRKLARILAYEAEQRNRKALPMTQDGPRYYCKWCHDAGIVLVADIYVREGGKAPIRAYLEGQTPHLPACGVFCFCTRGRGRTPQFDEVLMFPVALPGASSADAEKFNRWWSHGGYKSNRVRVFDEYNNRSQPVEDSEEVEA